MGGYAPNLPMMTSGANQFMDFPTMPVPGQNSPVKQSLTYSPTMPIPGSTSASGQVGSSPGSPYWQASPLSGARELPGGVGTGPTLDPQLTGQLAAYLQGQIGLGAMPYGGSAMLPFGQNTSPGQMTAPANPVLQSLQNFYLGRGGGPESYILPMWQSQLAAMEQPIQQQYANIKEQFGQMGALGSSEMAQAMANYGAQTAAQQQALLGQLTLGALPGMQEQAFGQQTLDQQAIQNAYQEWVRQQPEYSPLLQYQYGLGTTFPPIYEKKGGILDSILGSGGGIMSGLSGLLPALGVGGAGAAAGAGTGSTLANAATLAMMFAG